MAAITLDSPRARAHLRVSQHSKTGRCESCRRTVGAPAFPIEDVLYELTDLDDFASFWVCEGCTP